MAPSTHASNPPATAAAPSATTSRARPQGSRRKVNHSADDAAYHGVISGSALVGSKRAAGEKADGEPRVKRKRLEPAGTPVNGLGSATGTGVGRKTSNIIQDSERESRPSLVSRVGIVAYTSPYSMRIGQCTPFPDPAVCTAIWHWLLRRFLLLMRPFIPD